MITVNDTDIGKIVITPNNKIDKETEYLLKSICMMQLLCLNKEENKEIHIELKLILNDTVNKINKLYNYEEFDATANFN